MIAVQNQYIQSYGLQIWQACSQGQSGHDPLKLFSKRGRGQGQGTPVNFLTVNIPAKFEVRSFECSGQRLSVTTQNRWTQIRGPEHSRRQSLI